MAPTGDHLHLCPVQRERDETAHVWRKQPFSDFGSRMTVSRFSPIAKATALSSCNPSTVAASNASRRPSKARRMFRIPGRRRSTGSCSTSPRDSTCRYGRYSMRDRKATPFGQVHSSVPTNAVFSPRGAMGGLHERGTKSGTELRPTLPAFRRPASAPGSGPRGLPCSLCGRQTRRNCSTTRRQASLRGWASRPDRHLPSGIRRWCPGRSRPVRQPRDARSTSRQAGAS